MNNTEWHRYLLAFPSHEYAWQLFFSFGSLVERDYFKIFVIFFKGFNLISSSVFLSRTLALCSGQIRATPLAFFAQLWFVK